MLPGLKPLKFLWSLGDQILVLWFYIWLNIFVKMFGKFGKALN